MSTAIAQIEPQVMSEFQPGAILKDSWGGEQTSIDFYCIIERNGDWVKVLPMEKETVENNPSALTSKVKPVKINYAVAPIRKKMQKHYNEDFGFTFRNYTGGGWCRLWNGKPTTETHYG